MRKIICLFAFIAVMLMIHDSSRYTLAAGDTNSPASPALPVENKTVKADEMNIYYSMFSSGNVRSDREFFPGETVAISFVLPGSFIHDKKYDFDCNCYLTADLFSFPSKQVATPHSVFKGYALKEGESITNTFYFPIPKDIAPGYYRFQIEVVDRQVGKKITKSDLVTLLDVTTLKVHDIVLSHGFSSTNTWLPGSDRYVVGENGKLSFNICGLTQDSQQFIYPSLQIELVDENNRGVVVDEKESKMKYFSRMMNYNFTFTLTQPGKYKFNITIRDLNSKKEYRHSVKIEGVAPLSE